MKLKPNWSLTTYRSQTKLNIFRSNVLAVLLYGAEAWRMTKKDACRLSIDGQVPEKMLESLGMFRSYWPMKISNHGLYQRDDQG